MTSAEFKAIRLQLGLTQSELAKLMGCTQQAINRVENKLPPGKMYAAFLLFIKKHRAQTHPAKP